MNKKQSQGLIEYILVFIFATIIMYFFASQINIQNIKNFAIFGIKNNTNSKIILPPMTD